MLLLLLVQMLLLLLHGAGRRLPLRVASTRARTAAAAHILLVHQPRLVRALPRLLLHLSLRLRLLLLLLLLKHHLLVQMLLLLLVLV